MVMTPETVTNILDAVVTMITRIRSNYVICIQWHPTYKTLDRSTSDGALLEQFAFSNKENGWSMHIPDLPEDISYTIVNNKKLRLFIFGFDPIKAGDPDNTNKQPSPSQIHKLNCQSVYRFSIDESDGTISSNGYIWEDFFKVGIGRLDGEMLIRFIKNMKSIFTNYITFCYPEINSQNIEYEFSTILTAASLKRLRVPFTPQSLVDAFSCTLPVAEDIYDKFDGTTQTFTGLPWAIR